MRQWLSTPAGKVVAWVVAFIGAFWAFDVATGWKVSSDAEARYEMAVKSGDPREICRASESVVAAYQYAKLEEKYVRWKRLSDEKCLAFR